MLDKIIKMFSEIDYTLSLSNLLISAAFFCFVYILVKENKNNNIRWIDLLSQFNASGTSTISLTKVLQLIGGVTATWVVIVYTLKQNLQTEMFMTYLTYVGAIEGWSKFVAAKYGLPTAPESTVASDSTVTSNTSSTSETTVTSTKS